MAKLSQQQAEVDPNPHRNNVKLTQYLASPGLFPGPLNPWMAEAPVGKKSGNAPKTLNYNNDAELSLKLWEHYMTGQGQPVEIDLSKLDFSENINIPKLFKQQNPAIPTLLFGIKDPKVLNTILPQQFSKDLLVYGNDKVTHIFFEEPISNVGLYLPEWPNDTDFGKTAAFGRVNVDINKMHILVDREKQTVTIEASLAPVKRPDIPYFLDDFDFNPDPTRGRILDGITRSIHQGLPGVSYRIFAKPSTSAYFKKRYQYQDLY